MQAQPGPPNTVLTESTWVFFLNMPHTDQTHAPVKAPAMCQTLCRLLWRAHVHCLWSVNPHPCDFLFPVVSIAKPPVPYENMGCVCLSSWYAACIRAYESLVNSVNIRMYY